MKTILRFLFFLTVAFSVSNCVSVEKQIKNGLYDEAITRSISKLKGKKKKAPKYVLGLEEAYKQALNRDLGQIEHLKKSNPKDADLQIVRLFDRIEKYQSQIVPLLPLKDKHGYKADINLIDVSEGRASHENQAADYLYKQALLKLETGRKGAKKDARAAFAQLKEMEGIAGSNSLVSGLLDESKLLGTSFFEVVPQIGSKLNLSSRTADLFLDFRGLDLSSTWQTVHYENNKKVKYDYEVNFIFETFTISPEKENTREYQDKKEIEEDTGKKDREGKKITVKKEVAANVIELYQFKEIIATGFIVINDLKTGKEVFSDRLDTKKTFENYASTFKGDERALSDISRRRVGGRPLPFPSNDIMLDDAIKILKSDLQSSLKKQYTKY